MFDSFDRQITYLRISVTDRCNLRCRYCMPPEGIELKTRREILSFEDIVLIVRAAVRLGISKVRLTGGEPLVKKNLCHLIRELKAVRGIEEVAMTTNGILLDRLSPELKAAGLDRINISLDTLDPKKYEDITRGGDIARVLRGIRAAAEAGFRNTKINMVLIPGFNNLEVDAMSEFCRREGLGFQRINHYVLAERNSSGTAYEAEKPLPCHLCNRLRLLSDGRLKPCLFSDLEIPVDFSNIAASLERAVRLKPRTGKGCTARGIWEIGG